MNSKRMSIEGYADLTGLEVSAIKNENLFLKETFLSLQELCEEDRKTIATLTKQLKLSQEEVEFMRRKYELMWKKVVGSYSTNEAS